MALPALASATPFVGDLVKHDKNIEKSIVLQDDSLTLLTDIKNLTKKMLERQEILFENLMLALGGKATGPASEDMSGGRSDESDASYLKDLKIGFGDILFGAVMAYAFDLDKYIRTVILAKTIKNLGPIQKSLDSFSKAFAKRLKTFSNLKFLKPFTNAFKDFKNAFKTIGTETKGAVKTIVQLSEFKTFFGKLGARLGTILRPILEGVKKFFVAFKALAGKILFPLQIIFSVFDFVSGFLDGYAKKGEDDDRGQLERIWDGIKQGLIGVIKGIFTTPLDLLTKGVAYIAGLFGFEDAKTKILEWVNGDGGFTGLFDKLIEGLGKVIDTIGKWFGTLMTDPVQALKDLIGGYYNMLFKFHEFLYDKALKPIINWFGKLFGKEDASKSFESLVGDGFDWIKNFASKINEKFIQPVINWFKKIFSSDEKKPDMKLPGLDASGMNFNISGMIGEAINNAFQWMAKSIANSWFPGSKTLGGLFADTGEGIAKMMGAENIVKYSGKTKSIEIAKPGNNVTPKGAAVATQSQATGDKKPVVVVRGGDSAVQQTSVSASTFSAGNPKSTTDRKPRRGARTGR